jgi:23S rRNA (uracil1939-C5)-methyltransferase
VTPRCPYAEPCGGCTWQHLDYPAQLEMKREAVERLLTHAEGLDLAGVPVRPTIGADRDEGSGGVYYYRNKMEFSFAAQRWLTDAEIATGDDFDRHFALGLHVPGRFDKVLDLRTCFLQSEWSARLVNGIRDLSRREGWPPWHAREHTGWLRHLVIRQSASTDDRMVNLVTWTRDPDRLATIAAFLQAEFPETTTFVNTVNEGLANTSYGDTTAVFGPGTIRDRIGDHTFEIAPNAFFQTNTRQAETLYAVAAEMADLKPTDLVYDLYCGAGTISLFVAGRARHVVGVELVEEAVQNAKAAALANGVANTTFVAGDMLKLFTPDFVAEYGRPDVLVVDPPRAGMHPKVVDQIAALRPERIVYVSCNPRTQADDLARLMAATGGGYRVEAVQPVDLFPHTTHTECVVGLRAV